MATKLSDIDIDPLDPPQLLDLLDQWSQALVKAQKKPNKHPGIPGILSWIETTQERLRGGEPLDSTKTRIREFLGRTDQLAGIPLELD